MTMQSSSGPKLNILATWIDDDAYNAVERSIHDRGPWCTTSDIMREAVALVIDHHGEPMPESLATLVLCCRCRFEVYGRTMDRYTRRRRPQKPA